MSLLEEAFFLKKGSEISKPFLRPKRNESGSLALQEGVMITLESEIFH
jgi:hypothetical protein